MSELESAEALTARIVLIVEPVSCYNEQWTELEKLIEARDSAVRAALIAELRANYWGNRDTSWEAEAEKLLAKYQAKEASDA